MPAEPPLDDGRPIGLRAPAGSIAPHLLLLIVQLVALSGPRFPGRGRLVSAAILGLSVACHTNQFTLNLGLANLFALAWPHYLLTLANFVFASSPDGPEADLWPVDQPAQVALTLPAFSLRKLRWVLGTLVNLRGIRWNSEVAHLPRRTTRPAETEGRLRFLLLQAVDLAWLLLMADLVGQLGRKLFFIDPQTGALYGDSKGLSLASASISGSLANCFVFGSGPYFFINMQYVACSIVAVALNLSAPEDWPPLFGHLSEATTVRNFWNRFWHQMIRKGLTSFSTAFARSLGMPKGSTWYRYTHLFVAFAISGVMHAGSMLILPSPQNITWEERTVGIFLFFIHQALAITLEDFVQFVYHRVCGRSAPGTWSTLVGYIWVTCSFWYSLPLAGNTMLRLRMGQDAPLPYSVVMPLVEKAPFAA